MAADIRHGSFMLLARRVFGSIGGPVQGVDFKMAEVGCLGTVHMAAEKVC